MITIDIENLDAMPDDDLQAYADRLATIMDELDNLRRYGNATLRARLLRRQGWISQAMDIEQSAEINHYDKLEMLKW